MFSLIFLAASAAVSVPTPVQPNSVPTPVQPKGSPANWVLANDLPEIDGKSAVTTFDLTIDTSGLPIDCRIVVQSGSGQLDAAVCKALLMRARFNPSKDINGTTVASAYRERVRWLPSGAGPNRWFADADIIISTPALPKQVKGLAEAVVITQPGEGKSACVIKKSIGSANLDELACSIVVNPTVSPPIIIDGAEVRGVRLLRVAFQPDSFEKVTIR